MERLPLHIEYLLTRHDCVIVPGIGAFIASETEPVIDRSRGVVTSRRREISFNGSVISDDGLLAHSIARRERLSFEEAHKLLSKLSSCMRQELELERETSVGRIGRLILNPDGMMEFHPRRSDAEIDIHAEIPIFSRQSVTADTESEATSKASSHPVADSSSEEMAGRRVIYKDPDRYVFSISKRLVHAAAVVALILTVCISVLIPYHHEEEQRASVVPIEEFLRKPLVIEVTDGPKDTSHSTTTDTIAADKEIKIL